ncbi:hypothetical protein MNEG_2010 [Monoraphidium neglectum]|uniref:RecF/RecN/SMC N-terminal domain-containing protein n=1 Tax=Monoraphidium neglectum TaxID=145388 RepID=A0A0D2MTQ4_9CHLO|nr:hypothetical protein MNEG_2010 [Monoraphidium neglectum]KIZ05950.1 hypothetical protein MNEG_2010 [Monoraphidium neglectum]|eukprot:XP_013904969.1 hypothetical protein MNEG_2010 [Monoraphidium neglectum]
MVIGPLSEGLTCVVGPNGTGKSIVGEAIAFTLGGAKRMLRAKSLVSLINETAALEDAAARAQAQLQELLRPLGIQPDAVDRLDDGFMDA